MEFFLFQTDEQGRPTTTTGDEAGYFDLGPLDHGESTRREICMSLEQMGFEIEASHHEVAAGQHEIDFKYADALTAADNIMTFKLAVKTLAQKNGLHATFKEITQQDPALIRMGHLGMELYAVYAPVRVGHGGDGAMFRLCDGTEAVRGRFHLPGMAHPAGGGGAHAFQQRFAFPHADRDTC